jgi:hypothetical protein
MTDARDELIRARAHAIWEAEGQPDGRSDQHWQQAVLDVEQAAAQADAAPAVKPKRARKVAAAETGDAKPKGKRKSG